LEDSVCLKKTKTITFAVVFTNFLCSQVYLLSLLSNFRSQKKGKCFFYYVEYYTIALTSTYFNSK